YYYWDDFWSVAGLDAAADLASALEETDAAAEFRSEARDLRRSIDDSLAQVRKRNGRDAMPASPYRRLDAGTIGSIVAGYPLQIFAPDDPRLTDSVEYLLSHCTVHGGFFHNIIHSGINAYLTLHIAQVLMRAGDHRAHALVQSVADLASPTGQWPEAIHPLTKGGCMGDGQHGWAAAELIMMLRNSFVREEDDRLVVGAGIAPEWLNPGQRLFIGPTPTVFGDVTLTIEPTEEHVAVKLESAWRSEPREIECAIATTRPVTIDASDSRGVEDRGALRIAGAAR
ncbi:MAG TPA: hypothetical protein VKQ06_11535, partial [Gammaproteobacteria bacterium]|nr:hypothetical protein [Gammaproteobacteria bacterium]